MSSALPTSSSAAVTSSADTTAAARHAWEDTAGQASAVWSVQEDDEGNLILASSRASRAEAIRQRRTTQLHEGDYSQKRRGRIVRDLIRHLFVVVDGSRWVQDKDPALGRGTRFEVVVQVLQQFVVEYFDQNPLSHLGLILLRNGQAELLTSLSSNIKIHKLALESLLRAVGNSTGGEFSLQNGLELAGRSLAHLPKFASREVVVLMGALSTCDYNSNILTETMPRLVTSGVRVSVLNLAAELHVCRKIATATGGMVGVCMNGTLLRDWLLLGQVVPPPSHKKKQNQQSSTSHCEFVLIGFPTRHVNHAIPTLVHATRTSKVLTSKAYTCPQCQSQVMELPTDCAVCGLKLILAPHLARSYHFLFPVPAFHEVIVQEQEQEQGDTTAVVSSAATIHGRQDDSDSVLLDSNLVTKSSCPDHVCFACLKHLISNNHQSKKKKEDEETLRFQCPSCKHVFCADCDAYLHETLHNCPGCLS